MKWLAKVSVDETTIEKMTRLNDCSHDICRRNDCKQNNARKMSVVDIIVEDTSM
jgi:hypothetical protein